MLGAGASNVHTFVSKHVIDTSGRFNDKDGEPLRYSGHWSWIYFFNNEAVSDRCGIRVWQWMAQTVKIICKGKKDSISKNGCINSNKRVVVYI